MPFSLLVETTLSYSKGFLQQKSQDYAEQIRRLETELTANGYDSKTTHAALKRRVRPHVRMSAFPHVRVSACQIAPACTLVPVPAPAHTDACCHSTVLTLRCNLDLHQSATPPAKEGDIAYHVHIALRHIHIYIYIALHNVNFQFESATSSCPSC